MIRLEPVSERTFRKVVDMRMPPEQDRFVAPNVVSLAQAWLYYEDARPFAVCLGDEVVGFMMLDWDEGERTVGIWRFMIAVEHQRKGYGRQAMEQAIALAREAGCFDLIGLDYVPGNDAARSLYTSLGFRETGEIEDGEIIMELPLTDTPRVGMLTADEEDMEDLTALLAAEREANAPIPAELADAAAMEQAVLDGRVTRFTIMGKTIGLAVGAAILIGQKHSAYRAEAIEKYGA